jgi:hypothetical protein
VFRARDLQGLGLRFLQSVGVGVDDRDERHEKAFNGFALLFGEGSACREGASNEELDLLPRCGMASLGHLNEHNTAVGFMSDPAHQFSFDEAIDKCGHRTGRKTKPLAQRRRAQRLIRQVIERKRVCRRKVERLGEVRRVTMLRTYERADCPHDTIR